MPRQMTISVPPCRPTNSCCRMFSSHPLQRRILSNVTVRGTVLGKQLVSIQHFWTPWNPLMECWDLECWRFNLNFPSENVNNIFWGKIKGCFKYIYQAAQVVWQRSKSTTDQSRAVLQLHRWGNHSLFPRGIVHCQQISWCTQEVHPVQVSRKSCLLSIPCLPQWNIRGLVDSNPKLFAKKKQFLCNWVLVTLRENRNKLDKQTIDWTTERNSVGCCRDLWEKTIVHWHNTRVLAV